jgi:hypothetical protein
MMTKACLRMIFCFLFVLSAIPAFAAFENTGTGARATALGDTYVALGDDTGSLFYNPASLARLRQKEMATEYSRLFAGLSDNSNVSQYALEFGVPLKSAGTVAFGWKQLSLTDLYSERTLSLGYGQWLMRRLAAGIALKQLYHSYDTPSTVVDDNGNIRSGTPSLFSQNGASKAAISLDLGLLYRLSDRQWLGFSIQDANQPNVALDSSDPDVVPRTVRLGWAYQSAKKLSLTTALTTRQCPCDQRDYTMTAGVEKWWSFFRTGDFALRGSLALGTAEFRQYAMGFGYRFNMLEIDYAFVFNLSGITLGDTAGTHRFSVAYRFGAEPAPAMTPTGIPIEELPVNILNVPSDSMETDPLFVEDLERSGAP